MKRALLVLTVVIIGIQFIPVKRTNPPVAYDFDGPAEVKAILKRSCYDCHSNETEWPWYSRLAPASWFLAHHVKEGREHLNFSDWEGLKGMAWIPRKIHDEVEEGEMPMKSYLLIHSDAKVSPEELAVLGKWADQ